MTTTQPLIIDGIQYPYYSANLAITTSFVNGQLQANAAMRLVPTYLDENGNGVTKEELAKSVVVGTVRGLDEAEQEAMLAIHQAVQNYITVKGL